MIKAIIFDFDGTLSNRQVNAHDAYVDYLRKYFEDLNDIEFEAVVQDLLTYDANGTISVFYRTQAFIHKYHLPDNFVEKFEKFWIENMPRYTVLKNDCIEVLTKLRKEYQLAILSNGDSLCQHNKINKFHLKDYVDEIFVSGDYGIHKPDKRIFEMVAQKLNVNCEECIYVGDVFSNDVLGALRANMVPVWMKTDKERPVGFYQGYTIESLSQLFDVIKRENEK